MPLFRRLDEGDPLPRLALRSATNPTYQLDTVAGRYLVLAFLHDADLPAARRALAAVATRPDLFNDEFASFFGISTGAEPTTHTALTNRLPGYRFLWDADMAAAKQCSALTVEAKETQVYRQLWIVTDPTMRVIRIIVMEQDGSDASALLACLAALPPPAGFAGRPLQAPVLFLPQVFAPALCAELIAIYEAQGGVVSGYMRDFGGKTVGSFDATHKVRRDVTVSDQPMIERLQTRIRRAVIPEIAKIHQFHATRMERYLVACYDASEGGHFAPHRDNTTLATAHRRFAVSINLNDDFEGGEVSFPEYGPQSFKAPVGGAVVFSCALLHTVSRVTEGRRFAFLPFLYDDAAARIRDANRAALDAAPESDSA